MAVGGASRVTAKRKAAGPTPIPVRAAVVAAMAGITEMGPIASANEDSATPILNWNDFESLYGGFTLNARDLPLAVRSFFDEAGENSGAQLFISRVVHMTTTGDPRTATSTRGTLTLSTPSSSPSSGTVVGLIGPFDLTGQADPLTIVLVIDENDTPETATITATAAYRDSATGTTFALADGMTIDVILDQSGDTQTIVFEDDGSFANIGAATRSEIAAVINAQLAGGRSMVQGTAVRILSDRRGTSSGVNITGGTANTVLQFTTGNVAGTGNVANLAEVTVAELETIVEAVGGVAVTNDNGAPRITSLTTGLTSRVQVHASSTIDDELGFDNAPHTGLAGTPTATLLLEGRWDGEYIHEFSVQIRPAASGDANRRDLILLRNGVRIEEWTDWTLDETDLFHLVHMINEGYAGQRKSKYIKASYVGTLAAPYNLPASGTFGPFTGGGNGLVGLVDEDFIGGSSDYGKTGLRAFDRLPRLDEVAAPGRTTAAYMNALITYVDVYREGRTFGVLGTPAGMTGQQVRNHINVTARVKGTSETTRVVFPRIYVDNPAKAIYGNAAVILAPNEGAVMGVHARVSAMKVGGSFEQPAGSENGYFRAVRGVESADAEDVALRGLMQNDNITIIRWQRDVVPYLDGPNCLKSYAEGAIFGSVGESRGVMMVMNDLVAYYDGLRQLNITEGYYSRLTNAATNYLERLTDESCFFSRVYERAFFVDFGPAQNPASAVENQEVFGVIGLNTARPATRIHLSLTPYRGFRQAFEQQAA